MGVAGDAVERGDLLHLTGTGALAALASAWPLVPAAAPVGVQTAHSEMLQPLPAAGPGLLGTVVEKC